MSGLHLGPGLHLSLSPTSLALGKGELRPPTGFVFLIDTDGAYLTDEDGAYLLEAA